MKYNTLDCVVGCGGTGAEGKRSVLLPSPPRARAKGQALIGWFIVVGQGPRKYPLIIFQIINGYNA